MKRLKVLLQASPKSCFKFLNNFFLSKLSKTVDLLLVCPEAKTRALVANLLAFTFNQVIEVYKIDFSEESEPIDNDDNLFKDDAESETNIKN